MVHQHCVVWLDHQKAHVLFFDDTNVQSITIGAHNGTPHIHHKAGELGPGKAGLDRKYAAAIEAELRNCREFLLVGPGTAKREFVRHIHKHAPDLDDKLVGIETVDHPTDGQLAEYGRTYFRAIDRMNHTNDEVLAGVSAHHVKQQ